MQNYTEKSEMTNNYDLLSILDCNIVGMLELLVLVQIDIPRWLFGV